MRREDLIADALSFFEDEPSGFGPVQPVSGMLLLRHIEPTPMEATLYDPVVCLILQGGKETRAGDRVVQISAGEASVVSHHLPVVARITQADAAAPYLAMIVSLDVSVLRQLYEEVGDLHGDSSDMHALAVHEAGAPLIDALSRYLALASSPIDSKVLLSQVRREVHFRLLLAPNGGTLRRLLLHDSHASNVWRAIGHLRAHFRSPVSIPELASTVGMSAPSLHKHFKAVTSTTPLQYFKELCLIEARRLLAAGALTVSRVAYEVVYESPNQFSREYSRKFGVSPRMDRGLELAALN